MRPIVNRFPDANGVAVAAASQLKAALVDRLASQPQTHVVLTGGTVGIATLARFAELEGLSDIDFSRVHFWWGDERFVERNSPDRNAVQARNAMFRHLQVDEANIHEFPADGERLSLDESAEVFAAELERFAQPGAKHPRFDVVLLGMGPDGHVASLFPGKPTPSEGVLVVAEHDSPKPPPQRLSFSYELLNSAEEVWFVIAGGDKADAVASAFSEEPQALPVGRVHGKTRTVWFVDQTAGVRTWGC
mgnify:CR=1 FL=1